jgi:type II secretory pathway pseudopilin PulG
VRRLLNAWWIVLIVSAVVVIAVTGQGTIGRYHAIQRTTADIRAIQAALELHKGSAGRYPTTQEGLSALVGAQFTRVPTDPWRAEYVYALDHSSEPSVYSAGANGRDESGLGDDIVNGDKRYRCEDYEAYCARAEDVIVRLALGAALASLVVGFVRGVAYLWRWYRKLVPAA